MQQPRQSFLSILLVGLFVGAGLGIYGISPRFQGLSLMIAVVVLLVFSGYMGYRASANTGKISSGGLVGCLMGLVSAAVFFVGGVLYFFANIDRIMVATGIPFGSLFLAVSYFIALVFGAGVFCLIGWYGSVLGGTIGKSRAPDPAFSLHYRGAMPISPPPYSPLGFAQLSPNTLQGYIPSPYPPSEMSEYISSQRTAPIPTPSPPKRLKRRYSPALILLWIPLIVMLLGGGRVGVYQTVTGKWPWIAAPAPHAIAWSGSQFAAVGSRGILTSPNGRTWTAQYLAPE